MRLVAALCVAILLTVAAVSHTAAQGAPDGILILDQERFFSGSLFGQRVQDEIDAAGQALAAENRAIEAELTAEELDLTERRAEMPRAEFTILAEEFDIRVEQIRSEQEAKARALSEALDRGRSQFFEMALPILLEITADRGAAAILDRRSVLLAADAVDVTDAAIAAMDEAVGRGPDAPLIDLDALPETDAPPEPEGTE